MHIDFTVQWFGATTIEEFEEYYQQIANNKNIVDLSTQKEHLLSRVKNRFEDFKNTK